MHYLAKYAAVSALFLVTAGAVSAFGVTLASDVFAPDPAPGKSAIATAARTTDEPIASHPTSALLGAKPKSVAELKARQRREGEWVEVVDAVNMRQGPSSARGVIKVQLAGTALRVASRDGQWIEVIDPKSGRAGWVFEDYVKQIEPESRRADAAESQDIAVP